MRNSIGSLVYQTLLTNGCLFKLFIIVSVISPKIHIKLPCPGGTPSQRFAINVCWYTLCYSILHFNPDFSIIPYKCLNVYNILYLILYYYNIIIICLSLETFYNKLLCPIWWLRVFIPF